MNEVFKKYYKEDWFFTSGRVCRWLDWVFHHKLKFYRMLQFSETLQIYATQPNRFCLSMISQSIWSICWYCKSGESWLDLKSLCLAVMKTSRENITNSITEKNTRTKNKHGRLEFILIQEPLLQRLNQLFYHLHG